MKQIRRLSTAVALTLVADTPLFAETSGDTAADDNPHQIQLYQDRATGEVSNIPGENTVPLGTYLSAEALANQQKRMMEQMASLHSRLERLEADQPIAFTEQQLDSEDSLKGRAHVDEDTAVSQVVSAARPGIKALTADTSYDNRRIRWATKNNRFSLELQNRIQMRYASPFDNDPRSLAALRTDQESFMLRRTRTALTGHLLERNLTYEIQYDWSANILRDFSVNFGWHPSAQLRLGRGKVMYNDERWTSSSRQQFINRSIVNDLFTVDRQQGAQLHGRVFAGSPADFNYVIGVFTGRGISERDNDDDKLMYASRLQWNVLGRPMSRAQSDLSFTPRPNLGLAVAGMKNRSNCTLFATELDACRALPRFMSPEDAAPGQFELEQAMAELRFRWNGFSLQGEVHRKDVFDRTMSSSDPRRQTSLAGGFVQAGLLPHGWFSAIPRQLEFAMRYATIDPDDFRGNDKMKELTGVANWYLDGHENKVSLEFGRLTVEDPDLQEGGSENRIRLQWDIRF